MSDHYTISLGGGKYTVINRNGIMEFLRHGEAWQAAKDLQCGVVLALAQRIEELETAIRDVLDGSLAGNPERRVFDGMGGYLPAPEGHIDGCDASCADVQAWYGTLNSVLETP